MPDCVSCRTGPQRRLGRKSAGAVHDDGAGALEVSGVTGRLFENLSAGYGFTAIAVALLARLHPLSVVPAALFFAALATGSGAMQRVAHVPSVTVQVIEALVIFFSASFALPRRAD